MTLRTSGGVLVLLLATALPLRAADNPYAVKVVDAEPPKEVQEPIRKLLAGKSVQVANAKGDLLFELWFRKELPAKATEAQIKNGLTYREVPETTVVGAVHIAKAIADYRKQALKDCHSIEAIKAGAITGGVIPSAELKANIDACTVEQEAKLEGALRVAPTNAR